MDLLFCRIEILSDVAWIFAKRNEKTATGPHPMAETLVGDSIFVGLIYSSTERIELHRKTDV